MNNNTYQRIFIQGLKMTILHCLTGEEFSQSAIKKLFAQAKLLKNNRLLMKKALKDKHLALLFDKPSLRTRFSFTIAMRELGGDVVESTENTRKKETPEDTVRVLNGYCHGIVVRTFADQELFKMTTVAKIPIINGLTDGHHPCQILSDLFTLQEIYGSLSGLVLTYIGDANNILNSLILLAPQFGIQLRYCCPLSRQPDPIILHKSPGVQSFGDPITAVKNANIVYTDVWTSMGFENQIDESCFNGFQVNEQLMSIADKNAKVMHCLPMVRNKEISNTLADSPCSIIFQQSENRLHLQKALLLKCLLGE